MKLGVLTAAFGNQPFEEMLDAVKAMGLGAVELPASAYGLSPHCPVDELLKSAALRRRWLDETAKRGLIISSLSCHGNPLHPDPAYAANSHAALRKGIILAEKLGLDRVNGFSGCPGDQTGKSRVPNWVTCPWPPDFLSLVTWQWEKKALPYWRKMGKFAADHGVKIGFEMHPGFLVYNPETLLRLRAECGKNLGANFDPSHLFWQGIDPIEAVRALAGCIWHVHAKDCRVEPAVARVHGVLDTKHYGDEFNRAWIFRTCGYGHGEGFWRDFVSALRLSGYDHVLSIEHEDSLMTTGEGIAKAAAFLQAILIRDPKPSSMHWA
ncbi:MAG: sugar phosphate isomerase/epimerase [Planctomycetes bacterium]|nr:sugar phosphate isomerase/epimerase [Planctomycetota bacterium]